MDRHVSHEEIVELLGAYALDAVDRAETEAIARHIEQCPACAAEVAEHQRVAALLGNTSEDAPVYLWDEIADQLGDHTGADRYRAPRLDADGRRARRRVTAPGALRRLIRHPLPLAAAAAVVAVAVLSIQVARLDNRVSTLTGEQGLARLAHLAMDSPGAHTVSLVSVGSRHALEAEVVVQRSGAGYLIDRSLPELPATETYQLWGRAGRRLVSLGVLGPRPGTVAIGTGGPHAYSSFLVTAERAGGVPQPTGPLVASSLA